MTTKLPAWLLYLLAEVGILGAWLINWLTPSGADFSVLTTTPALKALVLLEVLWIVGCAAHWSQTGDATPIQPVTATTELKPGVELATAQHIADLRSWLFRELDHIESDIAALHEAVPQQPPAPPPPPSLEDFHRNEAGGEPATRLPAAFTA